MSNVSNGPQESFINTVSITSRAATGAFCCIHSHYQEKLPSV